MKVIAAGVVLLLLSIASGEAFAQAVPASPKAPEKCKVEGQVVKASDGLPLHRAGITL